MLAAVITATTSGALAMQLTLRTKWWLLWTFLLCPLASGLAIGIVQGLGIIPQQRPAKFWWHDPLWAGLMLGGVIGCAIGYNLKKARSRSGEQAPEP